VIAPRRERETEMAKRKWLEEMTIVVPSRVNADGTETPAAHYACEVETLPTGAKRVRSCVKKSRAQKK
jgi:hypothetical protein